MKDFDLYFRAWVIKDKYMSKVQDIDFVGAYVVIEDKDGNQVMKEKSEIILMQGLEINGKVVYEGDIIEYDLLSDGDRQRAGIEILRDLFNIERLILINGIEFEVIGNIYENKELVENER